VLQGGLLLGQTLNHEVGFVHQGEIHSIFLGGKVRVDLIQMEQIMIQGPTHHEVQIVSQEAHHSEFYEFYELLAFKRYE
jgi:hypothetical protein